MPYQEMLDHLANFLKQNPKGSAEEFGTYIRVLDSINNL